VKGEEKGEGGERRREGKKGRGGRGGGGGVEKGRDKHLPKHVRASYERDIDKVTQGFRVNRNMAREWAATGGGAFGGR